MIRRFLLWLAPLLLLLALALVYLALAAPRAALTPFSAPREAQPVGASITPLRQVVPTTAVLLGAPNDADWPDAARAAESTRAFAGSSPAGSGVPLAFSKPPDEEEAPAVYDVTSMGGSRLQAGGVGVPSPTSSAALSCSSPCHVDVSRPDGQNPWHRAVASSFGINDGYLGGHLACGGRLDNVTLVVAHRTLACGTRVTFRFRGYVVAATVRDRGPFVAGRLWDFGPAVARALHFSGLAVVEWRFP